MMSHAALDPLAALRARRHELCCLVCAREPRDGVTLFRRAPDDAWLCEEHNPAPPRDA